MGELMNRLSFSRQPSAYIGLVAAVLVVLTTAGIDVPPGLQAAIDGLIVAVGTVLTWTQVRPAASSIEVKPDTTVVVHEEPKPGVTKVTEHRLMNGKVAQIGAAATIATKSAAGIVLPAPVKAHPKKAAPAKKTAPAAKKKAK
jgi:hypothetical protein